MVSLVGLNKICLICSYRPLIASLSLNINYREGDQCQGVLEENGLHTAVMGKTERLFRGWMTELLKTESGWSEPTPLNWLITERFRLPNVDLEENLSPCWIVIISKAQRLLFSYLDFKIFLFISFLMSVLVFLTVAYNRVTLSMQVADFTTICHCNKG